jgi:predicted transposase/invertase (TIGR01784 family)
LHFHAAGRIIKTETGTAKSGDRLIAVKGERIATLKYKFKSDILFKLFDCEELYSEFALLERIRHELLCDKMELRFFELRKLPEEIDTNDMLQIWLKVLSVDTEEELTELENLGVNEVEQAIEAYKYIAGSPEYRELERMRERARHDEAQALSKSRRDRSREIASNFLNDGVNPEIVARNTGLSLDEVLALKTEH